MEATRYNDLRPDEALALAHVRKVKGFYVHAIQYGLVIAVLAAVSIATGGYWWFVWPALGWGFGIVAHAASVFDMIPFLNGDWERRQVEKHLGRKL
jgi:hypothetical protein